MIIASIVTYHTKYSDLAKLVEQLVNSTVFKIYIVDNSMNDGLREIGGLSYKIVYIHSLNLGYGSGHNIAIEKSMEDGAKYHIIINPDICIPSGAIEELTHFMNENIDCGLVMPKILYPDGRIQYLCKLLPTPIDLLGRRFSPLKKQIERCNDKYELRFTNYDKIMEVPSLSGCFMFIRMSTLKLTGNFDKRFFMYAEDLDLCRRIGEVSKTIYYPNIFVFHEYAKESYKNDKLLKYHILSIIKYFNKWGWFYDIKRIKKNRECLDVLYNKF